MIEPASALVALSASTAGAVGSVGSPGVAVAATPAFFNAALTSKPSGHALVGAAIALSAACCSLSTETFGSEPPHAVIAVLKTVDTATAAMPAEILTRSSYRARAGIG